MRIEVVILGLLKETGIVGENHRPDKLSSTMTCPEYDFRVFMRVQEFNLICQIHSFFFAFKIVIFTEIGYLEMKSVYL